MFSLAPPAPFLDSQLCVFSGFAANIAGQGLCILAFLVPIPHSRFVAVGFYQISNWWTHGKNATETRKKWKKKKKKKKLRVHKGEWEVSHIPLWDSWTIARIAGFLNNVRGGKVARRVKQVNPFVQSWVQVNNTFVIYFQILPSLDHEPFGFTPFPLTAEIQGEQQIFFFQIFGFFQFEQKWRFFCSNVAHSRENWIQWAGIHECVSLVLLFFFFQKLSGKK